jgi:hypothetical protein
MGNSLKCKECEKNNIKDYAVELKYTSHTELYTRSKNILGVRFIPKTNTRTKYYVCSNSHTFETREKCV